MSPEKKSKRIAIVGTGGAGLAALYALGSTNHEVTLFEAEGRVGGHLNAATFINPENGQTCLIDTAFQIINDTTYPNFTAVLNTLNVACQRSSNSMSVCLSTLGGRSEWSSRSIFTQTSNLFRPSFWRMLFDICRFNTFASDVLLPENGDHFESVGEYLKREGYSRQFADDYLLPITGSIWGIESSEFKHDFPVRTLVRYMWNHKLLNTVKSGLDWVMIKGTSDVYIKTLLKHYPPANIRLNKPIRAIGNDEYGVWVQTDTVMEHFDHVIITTSAPVSLNMIRESATKEELEILGSFKTAPNTIVMHTDQSFMPTKKSAWTAYNYSSPPLSSSTDLPQHQQRASVTCWMNQLQHIPASLYGNIFATVNPAHSPTGEQGRWTFDHPCFTPESVVAQGRLDEIQGKRGIVYTGAWTKYGFHEDAFVSGIRAARLIAPEIDVEVVDVVERTAENRTDGLGLRIRRKIIRMVQRLLVS